MVTDGSLHYTPAMELGRLLRRRELSPVELTDAILDRVERLNPTLGAFITVTADLARAEARAAEQRQLRGELRGPLDGIPDSIKDMEHTAGIRTTYGSKWFAQHVPEADSLVAGRPWSQHTPRSKNSPNVLTIVPEAAVPDLTTMMFSYRPSDTPVATPTP